MSRGETTAIRPVNSPAQFIPNSELGLTTMRYSSWRMTPASQAFKNISDH
jgi:hypothetical protein